MGAGLGISTLFERLVYLQEVSAGGGIDPTAPAEGSIVAAEAGAQPMAATDRGAAEGAEHGDPDAAAAFEGDETEA
jgi:hypothetical protein